MRKFIVVLFLTSISSLSYSASGAITIVHFYQGHDGVLLLKENMTNPDNCSRNDRYILSSAHPFFKEIYSLLLAAHLSDQPVDVGVEGCVENFPSVRHVLSTKSP